MKNAMQLKAIVKNTAKEKHISSQLVLQNYMLERLLERLSLSEYRNNFILKGGFLIAAIIGLDSRTTMDMDGTIKGMTMNEKSVRRMLDHVLRIDLNDNVQFVIKSINEIREEDQYKGYRVSLLAEFSPMLVPLKIDITTGNKITPKEIEYKYKLLFEKREISILAYNIETIIAEKLETVISRADLNTRIRDYYDIYILNKLQISNIKVYQLREALKETAIKRGTYDIMKEYEGIMHRIESSKVMKKRWENYQYNFHYVKEISLMQCCNAVINIMREIFETEDIEHSLV